MTQEYIKYTHAIHLTLNLTKHFVSFFRLGSKIAKSHYQLHHVCLSVRPHGTTPLPLDGFS
jgi:hypothetical protein